MFAKVNFIVPLDQVCLGDSCLIVEVEKDYTVYGDELKFGGGKVSSYFVIKNYFFFFCIDLCVKSLLAISESFMNNHFG